MATAMPPFIFHKEYSASQWFSILDAYQNPLGRFFQMSWFNKPTSENFLKVPLLTDSNVHPALNTNASYYLRPSSTFCSSSILNILFLYHS